MDQTQRKRAFTNGRQALDMSCRRAAIILAILAAPLLVKPAPASAQAACAQLSIAGDIGSFTFTALRHQIDALPGDTKCATLLLDSLGGSFQGSRRLADVIRQAKDDRHLRIDTLVDNRCESACVLVFLAGQRRIATSHATFMVHAVTSQPGGAGQVLNQQTSDMLKEYASDGINPDWIAAEKARGVFVTAAKHYLRAAELARSYSGIVTAMLTDKDLDWISTQLAAFGD